MTLYGKQKRSHYIVRGSIQSCVSPGEGVTRGREAEYVAPAREEDVCGEVDERPHVREGAEAEDAEMLE
jgi:hypothetical protein